MISPKDFVHHGIRAYGQPTSPAWTVDFWLAEELLWTHKSDTVPSVGERWHGFIVTASEVSSFGIVDVSLEWADNAPLLAL